MDADFNYWAVSDVSDSELQSFKQLSEGRVLQLLMTVRYGIRRQVGI